MILNYEMKILNWYFKRSNKILGSFVTHDFNVSSLSTFKGQELESGWMHQF